MTLQYTLKSTTAALFAVSLLSFAQAGRAQDHDGLPKFKQPAQAVTLVGCVQKESDFRREHPMWALRTACTFLRTVPREILVAIRGGSA